MLDWDTNGFIAEPNAQRLADDFVSATHSNVTSLRWNGVYRRFEREPWVVGSTCKFRVEFFDFAGSNPSSQSLVSFDADALVTAIVGYTGFEFRGTASVQFSLTLPSPVEVGAGHRYAVSILENDSRTRGSEYLWALPSFQPTASAWVYAD